MAHINLHDYTGFGLDFASLDAVSYQFAKDKDFKYIIDESLYDTENLESWSSPLPMRPEDGDGFYGNECQIHARVRIHLSNTTTDWYVLPVRGQRDYNVMITQKNKNPVFTTSVNIGWTKECGINPADGFAIPGLTINSGDVVQDDKDENYDFSLLPYFKPDGEHSGILDKVFDDRDQFNPDGSWVPAELPDIPPPDKEVDDDFFDPGIEIVPPVVEDTVWEDDLGALYIGNEKAFVDLDYLYLKNEYDDLEVLVDDEEILPIRYNYPIDTRKFKDGSFNVSMDNVPFLKVRPGTQIDLSGNDEEIITLSTNITTDPKNLKLEVDESVIPKFMKVTPTSLELSVDEEGYVEVVTNMTENPDEIKAILEGEGKDYLTLERVESKNFDGSEFVALEEIGSRVVEGGNDKFTIEKDSEEAAEDIVKGGTIELSKGDEIIVVFSTNMDTLDYSVINTGELEIEELEGEYIDPEPEPELPPEPDEPELPEEPVVEVDWDNYLPKPLGYPPRGYGLTYPDRYADLSVEDEDTITIYIKGSTSVDDVYTWLEDNTNGGIEYELISSEVVTGEEGNGFEYIGPDQVSSSGSDAPPITEDGDYVQIDQSSSGYLTYEVKEVNLENKDYQTFIIYVTGYTKEIVPSELNATLIGDGNETVGLKLISYDYVDTLPKDGIGYIGETVEPEGAEE